MILRSGAIVSNGMQEGFHSDTNRLIYAGMFGMWRVNTLMYSITHEAL